MNRVGVVIAVVLLSSSAFASPANKPAKRAARAKPTVTVIDASAPSAPESPWPTVAKKGHL